MTLMKYRWGLQIPPSIRQHLLLEQALWEIQAPPDGDGHGTLRAKKKRQKDHIFLLLHKHLLSLGGSDIQPWLFTLWRYLAISSFAKQIPSLQEIKNAALLPCLTLRGVSGPDKRFRPLRNHQVNSLGRLGDFGRLGL
jgi:hypothetical protein